MDRRPVVVGLALVGALLAAGPASAQVRTLRTPQDGLPHTDAARLERTLLTLGEIGRDPATGGVSRPALSDADLTARTWFAEQLRGAGMEVRIDAAGNLIGRLAGNDPSAPPIVLGSHLDTVPGGGRYDGATGLVAALEVVRTLQDMGMRPLHPLEIVDFTDEEGGLVGSRAWIGTLTETDRTRTYAGLPFAERLKAAGAATGGPEEARRVPGDLAAYLELHVEQGRSMEREGMQVGIVEGIVALREYEIIVRGTANHAGTTRMADRQDPAAAAARMMVALSDEVARQGGSLVATVGRMITEPGVPNVIPREARFSIDIRDPSTLVLEASITRLQEAFSRIAGRGGVTLSWEPIVQIPPAPCDPVVMKALEDAAARYGYPHTTLPSGAGHDAQSVARIAPMGMLFVPSVGGFSHTPAEYSRTEDIAAGADVLLQAVLLLDQRLK